MEEILKMYADPDGLRDWMKAPFTFDGYSGATDGVTLIFTKGEIADFQPLSQQDAVKVRNIIPPENVKIEILFSDLQEACSKAPLVDEMETKGEDIECKACDGEGEVEFEFSYNRQDFHHDFDCPVCDGSGYESEEKEVPTGNKIPDPDCLLQFGSTRLKLRYVDRLIKVSEHEKEPVASIVSHSGPVSPILFKVGKTKILIMPVCPTEKDVVIHRFDFKES